MRGGHTASFSGIVTEFGPVAGEAVDTLYVARIEPSFALLRLHSGYGVHQNTNAPDIIGQTLNNGGLSGSDFVLLLSGGYSNIEFALQYDESPVSFVNRLMEDEGIFYYFGETAASTQLVLGDATGAYSVGGSGTYAGHLAGASAASDRFTSLADLGRHYSGLARVRGFDLDDPESLVEGTASGFGPGAEGVIDHYTIARGNNLSVTSRAIVIAERARGTSSSLRGTSNLVDLRAGHTFDVSDLTTNGFAGCHTRRPRIASRSGARVPRLRERLRSDASRRAVSTAARDTAAERALPADRNRNRSRRPPPPPRRRKALGSAVSKSSAAASQNVFRAVASSRVTASPVPKNVSSG